MKQPPLPPNLPALHWEELFETMGKTCFKPITVKALKSSLYRCAWLDLRPEIFPDLDNEYWRAWATEPYVLNGENCRDTREATEAELNAYEEAERNAEAWRVWGLS